MRKTIFQQKEAEVLNGNFINWDVPLLGSNSYKVKKGEKYGWKTYIMYMAPHTLNSKGINLCPKASEGCMATCLFTAGRGGYSNVMLSRRNKSNMFVADKQRFMNKLVDELMVIERKQNKANERFAVRLNGTTDISFEKIKIDSHGKKNDL